MEIQRYEMAGLGKYMAGQQVDAMAAELAEQSETGAESPLWVLEYVQAAIAELEKQRERWAATARRQGASFTEIGEALGVSKQAARQRYGKTE